MYTVKHSFFCPSIEDLVLSPEESNHAVRVLRLKIGDLITVIDGKGRTAEATITNDNKKQVGFSVNAIKEQKKRHPNVHIAIAPTKNMDRFSFFVEKVIEIGVETITPILTKNSERKVINIEKLRKNAVSAMKQSGNLFLPKINEMVKIEAFLSSQQNDAQLFIAHCDDDEQKMELKNRINDEKNVVILIGPEGDFTLEEIKLAKQNSFEAVSLGESRLRTETAGIIACHTVTII